MFLLLFLAKENRYGKLKITVSIPSFIYDALKVPNRLPMHH